MSTLISVFRFYRLNINNNCTFNIRTLFTSSIQSKDNSNGNDSENVDKEETEKKLNDLLQMMLKPKPVPESAKKLELPRPRVEAQKKHLESKAKRLAESEKQEKEKLGTRLADAASKVADTLGGDKEKTEKELLELYLGLSQDEENLDKKLEQSGKPKMNMEALLSSMKIDKAIPEERSRAHVVRSLGDSYQSGKFFRKIMSKSKMGVLEKVNILGEPPLNIFTTDSVVEKGPPAETVVWDFLEKRDIRLSVTQPPGNIFEELILWTEQGKIWKFPIDNEQDWKEEENVDFTEHVFLEPLIEPWCPSSGPIRHFMELVCVGLSKNPYMKVEEKRAHLCFYEHYFRSKNNLLIELGLDPIKDGTGHEEDRANVGA